MTGFIELGFSCFRGWPTNSMIWECCPEPRASSCVPLAGTVLHTHGTVRWGTSGSITASLIKSYQQQLWEEHPNQSRSWRSKAAKSWRFCLLICPSLCTCLSAQTWHSEDVHHQEMLPPADVWLILWTGAVLWRWFLLRPIMVLKIFFGDFPGICWEEQDRIWCEDWKRIDQLFMCFK